MQAPCGLDAPARDSPQEDLVGWFMFIGTAGRKLVQSATGQVVPVPGHGPLSAS